MARLKTIGTMLAALMLYPVCAAADDVFLTNGSAPPPVATQVAAPQDDAVFFTPVAGYRRVGYQCVPLMEVTNTQSGPVRFEGTVCRSLLEH